MRQEYLQPHRIEDVSYAKGRSGINIVKYTAATVQPAKIEYVFNPKRIPETLKSFTLTTKNNSDGNGSCNVSITLDIIEYIHGDESIITNVFQTSYSVNNDLNHNYDVPVNFIVKSTEPITFSLTVSIESVRCQSIELKNMRLVWD